MIKYFCDKCGKEISTDIFIDVFEVKIKPPEIRSWSDDAETGIYFLCNDCTEKLNKWIRKKDD